MRLLVTRPEPDGERTAAALRARGHDVLLAPLLRVEGDRRCRLGAWSFAWTGVVITSANAARALAAHPRARRARAAAAVRGRPPQRRGGARCGLRRRDVGRWRRARSRAACWRAAPAPRALLHLAGEDRAVDVAAELAAGTACRCAPWRSIAPSRPQPFRRPVGRRSPPAQLDGVLHFSRRSAEAFSIAPGLRAFWTAALALTHYCLSPQVAEPLAAAGAPLLRVAPRPDEAALLGLVPLP